MAQAIAKCTCKECGAAFKVTAIRNSRKDADSWEEWAKDYYDLCSDCEEKARAKKASELAEKAKAEGLPELRGTERQIVWAEQLRANRLKEAESLTNRYIACAENENDPERKAKYNETISHITKAFELMISHEYAGWWIDERMEETKRLLSRLYKEYKVKAPVEEPVKTEEKVNAKAEATVQPEEVKHIDSVEISATDDRVSARYMKDDAFREEVKSRGFKWDGTTLEWYLPITLYTGTAQDRAADIGNQLLRAGFAITIFNAEIRNKAVNADFVPQTDKWITKSKEGAKVAISWNKNDSIYAEAKKLKGARWSDGKMLVPISNWKEVEEFAELNGFSITPEARKAIDEYKARAILTVNPATPAPVEVDKDEKLAEILKSSREVLSDLIDND